MTQSKRSAIAETFENPPGGAFGLVGQDREPRDGSERVDRFGHPIVQARRGQQTLVVQERRKQSSGPSHRLDVNASRRERAPDEHRGAIPDHLGDGVDGDGLAAELDDQCVGSVGQVLLGIDQVPSRSRRRVGSSFRPKGDERITGWRGARARTPRPPRLR